MLFRPSLLLSCLLHISLAGQRQVRLAAPDKAVTPTGATCLGERNIQFPLAQPVAIRETTFIEASSKLDPERQTQIPPQSPNWPVKQLHRTRTILLKSHPRTSPTTTARGTSGSVVVVTKGWEVRSFPRSNNQATRRCSVCRSSATCKTARFRGREGDRAGQGAKISLDQGRGCDRRPAPHPAKR